MKTLTWMVCVLALTTLNPQAFATQTRVLRIDPSSSASQPALIYLEDGRLLRIDPKDRNQLKQFEMLEKSGDSIEFHADRIGRFHRVSELALASTHEENPSAQNFNPQSNAVLDYAPTDLGTVESAQAQFKKLSPNMRKRSQCYQRAENWSYEMWTRSQIQSQKLFMFFTKKYIREYDYDWWFHVTPMVIVAGAEYTMDRTFTNQPLTIPKWTVEFMPKNVNCPVVAKFSDYENHQDTELCYHIKVPMYYYQPKDVEAMEKGIFVTDWVPWELAHAQRAYY